jgi:hypothetical protein
MATGGRTSVASLSRYSRLSAEALAALEGPLGIRETVTCRRLRVLVSFGSVQLCSFFSLSDTVGYKEA